MNIGFIGAGKVGFSLGRYFAENGIPLSGYYSLHVQSAAEAAKFTGSKVYYELSDIVKDSSALFITTPDSAVSEVYESIKEIGIEGKCVCHCSGAMSAAETFPDIREYGASGYSIHPLFPISSKYESFKELHSAFFCIEGDEEHLADWEEIFGRLGNDIRIISGRTKGDYHAACAISSNLVCGLAAKSMSLMKKCGFSETEALKAFEPLIMSNIKRILAVGPEEALTGPVERNDAAIVSRHIQCMDNDTDRSMYKAVSRKLVEIAQHKHPEADYSEMKNLLK